MLYKHNLICLRLKIKNNCICKSETCVYRSGKGCYVSVQNQDFYLEEQQKKIEVCFNEAIEIARVSGISLEN